MFMQADEHLYECLITCRSEKKYIWNGVKFVIFTFFIVELHVIATYGQYPAFIEISLWEKPTSNCW